MKHNHKERLSAAIDNELSPFETKQVLRSLAADRALSGKWARYHLIGDVMRGELRDDFDKTFAARVMQRIEQEAIGEEEEPLSRKDAWRRTLAGLAIAASVAAVSLLTLKLLTGGDGSVSRPVVGQGDFASAPMTLPQPGAPLDGVRTVSSSPGNGLSPTGGPSAPRQALKDPRINSYLAAHAEHAARSGLMARVRIVGFEDDNK